MVGAPYDFEVAESRAIFLEPAPDHWPGDQGVKKSREPIDGNLRVLCGMAGVVYGDQMDTILSGLLIFGRAPGDKFVE